MQACGGMNPPPAMMTSKVWFAMVWRWKTRSVEGEGSLAVRQLRTSLTRLRRPHPRLYILCPPAVNGSERFARFHRRSPKLHAVPGGPRYHISEKLPGEKFSCRREARLVSGLTCSWQFWVSSALTRHGHRGQLWSRDYHGAAGVLTQATGRA